MKSIISLNESTCVSQIKVDALTAQVQVIFKTGIQYNYDNVPRASIMSLLFNPDQSWGQWVNHTLKQEGVEYTQSVPEYVL